MRNISEAFRWTHPAGRSFDLVRLFQNALLTMQVSFLSFSFVRQISVYIDLVAPARHARMPERTASSGRIKVCAAMLSFQKETAPLQPRLTSFIALQGNYSIVLFILVGQRGTDRHPVVGPCPHSDLSGRLADLLVADGGIETCLRLGDQIDVSDN